MFTVERYTYLYELRKRLIYCLVFFAAFFILFFASSDHLFTLIVKPLQITLKQPEKLISFSPTAALYTTLTLALHTAFLFTLPIVLFHLWQFTAPGLYGIEKQQIRKIIVLSLVLFVGGVLFCYTAILPWMFQFFIANLPEQVQFLPDMTLTIRFILYMLYLFGLCFQIPLICMVLTQWGLLSKARLIQLRPYGIVLAFILGMLLTPPDVFSQILVALPLWALYELGILLSRS